MAIDYAEKEREFLEGLAEDTGRDLDGWMAAIAEANPGDRNAIIDWLRTQGFLFAKASWLERIHHNGGRPIYLDAPVPKAMPVMPAASQRPASEPAPAARPAPDPAPAARPAAERATVPATRPTDVKTDPHPPVAAAAPSAPSPSGADREAALEVLLAEAKAYRPLATFVLKEIERMVPDVQFIPEAGYVALHHALPIGALTIAPRELRLALAFGPQPAPDPFVKARFPKTHPNMPGTLTHMVILNDARQITPALLAAVRAVALQPSS